MARISYILESRQESDAMLATRSSLLLRLRDLGDERSWREFFDVYWRLLFHVARKRGFSQEDAEDVVQQTVSAVVRKMPDFEYNRKKGTFKGWLMCVLRNRMIDQGRKRGRRIVTVSLGEESGEDSGQDDFEDLWNNEWSSRRVELALGKLKQRVSPRQFQIFYAFVVREWSMQETREVLGVSDRQVYMAKYRVGKKFKEEFEALGRDELSDPA